MTAALLLTVKISVSSMILATGLSSISSTLADLTYLWRRPAQLVRSLLAMCVVIPLVALLMVMMADLPRAVELALLVVAVSAGAPLLPRKLMKIGHESYMLSLVMTSTAVAVVAVPIWLEFLRPLYGITTELRPFDVAPLIGKSFVGPIAVGMLICWRFPEISERVADVILKVGGTIMIACVLVLLVLHGRLLLQVGWPTLLTLSC